MENLILSFVLNLAFGEPVPRFPQQLATSSLYIITRNCNFKQKSVNIAGLAAILKKTV